VPTGLPEPQRSEASRLLRDYIDLRIRVPTLAGRAEVEEAVKRAEGIQDALWALQSLTELSDCRSSACGPRSRLLGDHADHPGHGAAAAAALSISQEPLVDVARRISSAPSSTEFDRRLA